MSSLVILGKAKNPFLASFVERILRKAPAFVKTSAGGQDDSEKTPAPS
jgi:hypothetical protein